MQGQKVSHFLEQNQGTRPEAVVMQIHYECTKINVVTVTLPDQAIFGNLDTVQRTGEQETFEASLLFFPQPV